MRNAPKTQPSAAAPQSADAQGVGSRVRLIQVRGDPVTVRSPSRGLFVHCRGIDYAPNPLAAAGTLVALGPGVLQGHLPSDPSDKYDAKWAREFRFEPVDNTQHRAAIVGDATVRYQQIGTITADEIFAWMTPKKPPAAAPPPAAPANPGASGWQLERLLAPRFRISERAAATW